MADLTQPRLVYSYFPGCSLSAFYCTDHTTHFYALGGPDFIMGPDAPVAERNILGVIHRSGWKSAARSSRCASTATRSWR